MFVCVCWSPHFCPFLSHVSNVSHTTFLSIFPLYQEASQCCAKTETASEYICSRESSTASLSHVTFITLCPFCSLWRKLSGCPQIPKSSISTTPPFVLGHQISHLIQPNLSFPSFQGHPTVPRSLRKGEISKAHSYIHRGEILQTLLYTCIFIHMHTCIHAHQHTAVAAKS